MPVTQITPHVPTSAPPPQRLTDQLADVQAHDPSPRSQCPARRVVDRTAAGVRSTHALPQLSATQCSSGFNNLAGVCDTSAGVAITTAQELQPMNDLSVDGRLVLVGTTPPHPLVLSAARRATT